MKYHLEILLKRWLLVVKSDRSAIMLILLLVLFHGINNYQIMNKSHLRIGVDSEIYYELTREFVVGTVSNQHVFANLKDLFNGIKPPLYFITASPFFLINRDINTLAISNLLYLTLLLFSVYGIGKRLYNEEVGITSAFLVSMFPSVFGLSRIFQIEIALTAIVSLTFYLFVLDKFDSALFSTLAAFVMGLGMLTKQTYIIFLFPMLLYSLKNADNIRNSKRLVNLSGSILLGGVIAASWYFRHDRLSWDTYNYIMFQCRDNKDMFFYVKTLFFQQLYPVFFSFFIISFIYFIKKKSYFFPFLLLFLFTVFSVMTNKAEKHILPLFPFIAIMISAWLFSLRAKTIAGIAILLSFLQFFCVSYLLGGIVTGNAHLKYFAYPYPPNGGLLCREIDRGNWKDAINQAIGLVKSNSRNGSAKTVFISDDVWDPPEIRYQSIIQGFKIDIPCPLLDSDIMILTDSEIESLCGLQIDRADFVMIEDSKEAINMKMRYQRELRGCFRKDISKFNLIGSVMFSENRPMSIYKRVIARSR